MGGDKEDWYIRLEILDKTYNTSDKEYTLSQLFVQSPRSSPDASPFSSYQHGSGGVKQCYVEGGLVLGRQSSSTRDDLHSRGFNSPIVSRNHAQLAVSRRGHVYVTDLNSMHGTMIVPDDEDARVVTAHAWEPIQLITGDILTLGRSISAQEKQHAPVRAKVVFRYPLAGGSARLTARDRLSIWTPHAPIYPLATYKYKGEILDRVKPFPFDIVFEDGVKALQVTSKKVCERIEVRSVSSSSSLNSDGENRHIARTDDIHATQHGVSKRTVYGVPDSILYPDSDDDEDLPRGSKPMSRERSRTTNSVSASANADTEGDKKALAGLLRHSQPKEEPSPASFVPPSINVKTDPNADLIKVESCNLARRGDSAGQINVKDQTRSTSVEVLPSFNPSSHALTDLLNQPDQAFSFDLREDSEEENDQGGDGQSDGGEHPEDDEDFKERGDTDEEERFDDSENLHDDEVDSDDHVDSDDFHEEDSYAESEGFDETREHFEAEDFKDDDDYGDASDHEHDLEHEADHHDDDDHTDSDDYGEHDDFSEDPEAEDSDMDDDAEPEAVGIELKFEKREVVSAIVNNANKDNLNYVFQDPEVDLCGANPDDHGIAMNESPSVRPEDEIDDLDTVSLDNSNIDTASDSCGPPTNDGADMDAPGVFDAHRDCSSEAGSSSSCDDSCNGSCDESYHSSEDSDYHNDCDDSDDEDRPSRESSISSESDVDIGGDVFVYGLPQMVIKDAPIPPDSLLSSVLIVNQEASEKGEMGTKAPDLSHGQIEGLAIDHKSCLSACSAAPGTDAGQEQQHLSDNESELTDTQSSPSTDSPITPPSAGKTIKRPLPEDFDELFIEDRPSPSKIPKIEPNTPDAAKGGLARTVGLVALGMAIGSVSTIAGLMQLAD